MAALDFPASPTVGQTATLTNGFTYQWDGAVWTLAASTGQQAGGDLTGTYPNPLIGPGAVGNAEISDVAYGKITGAPAALPPSGAAGGDLTGTYPNPTVAKAAGSFSVGGNITAASSNLSMGGGTMPGLLQMLGGTDARVFLSSNHPYGPGDTTKSSWILYMDAAGDQTLIGRRAPNAAVGAVNWAINLLSNGKMICTLNDGIVTKPMIAANSCVRSQTPRGAVAASTTVAGPSAWTKIATTGAMNTTGGLILINVSLGAKYVGSTGVNALYLGWGRDGAGVAEAFKAEVNSGSGLTGFPWYGFTTWDGVASGSHVWDLWVYVVNSNGSFITSQDSPGYIWATEYS